MRWLKKQSWLRKPWPWFALGVMLLNFWAGCSEPPTKAPEAKVEPSAKTEETKVPPAAKPPEDPPVSPERTPEDPPESKLPPPSFPAEPVESVSDKLDVGPKKPDADLFADWEQPAAVLLLSGDQHGYIEPCGCAGLENQKGGLKRRHTFVKQFRERGWPLALFDLGEQVRRFGVQPEIKFRTAIQSLEKIGYQVVGFGPDDLQLPAEQFLTLDLPPDTSLFVSANVVNEFAPKEIAPYKIVTVGKLKIGVTTVLGPTNSERIRNEGIQIGPAAEAIAAILPKMQAEADYLVLLSNSTLDEAKALGKQFPEFNMVVTASGVAEPPFDTRVIEGTEKTYLVELGEKGMYLAAIGLSEDLSLPPLYKTIPLDKTYADSPEMQKLFTAYQRNLKAIGLGGLDLRRRAHERGAEFVGSKECAVCHTKAFEIWEKTPHAHATETLTKLEPPRQFDAECLSCHVTGWELNPGTYVPYLSGYYDDPPTPHLFGNGCENCHGPGSKHVKAESGEVDADETMLASLREEMRLPLAQAEATCIKCHDDDNSPEFKHKGFAEYWKHVEHKGKD